MPAYRRIDSPDILPSLTMHQHNHERDPVQNGPIFSLPTRDNFQWRPNVTPERRKLLLLSYLPDWLITLALAAIFFALDKVDGYQRVFSLADTSIRHPFAVHERVPDIALYFICGVAPLVLQWIVNGFTIRSFWDAHNAALGLFVGLAITGSITQFAKITVGRPRPDFVDRCQPIPGSVDPTYGLSVAKEVCTQVNKKIMRDGFRSFPSGHSSMSFAGLGHLSYYLSGKLHLFDTRGHAGKAWLAVSPFAAASLVAISRTMDYRHHWHDVLVGAILGTLVSYFSYRQYYPPLNSSLSHRPYSPRIPAATVGISVESGTEQGYRMTERHSHSNHSSLSEADPTHSFQNTSTTSNVKSGLYGESGLPTPKPTYPPQQLEPTVPRFAHPPGIHSREEEEDELVGGTVKREGPESLRKVWQEEHEALR